MQTGEGDSWCLLQGLVWGCGGAGVKPTEEMVELGSSLFIYLSSSSTFPLEAGYLPHPTPYFPGVDVL